jgi:hypothetical protein
MTDTSPPIPSPEQIAEHLAFAACDYVDGMVFRHQPVCVAFLRAAGWQGREAVAGAEWLLRTLEHVLFVAPPPVLQNAPWRGDLEEQWRRMREALEAVRDENERAVRGEVTQ